MEQYDQVAVLDFAFDFDVFVALAETVSQVIVLDHHDTAIQNYRGKLPQSMIASNSWDVAQAIKGEATAVWMTNDHSGAALARLVALQFHPLAAVPDWVLNVDDRDRWVWALDDTKAVCAFLNTVDKSYDGYETVATMGRRDMAVRGDSILLRERSLVEEITGTAWEVVLLGERIPIVECPASLCSEVGHELAVKSEHGWSATFRHVMIDKQLAVKWSLRSVDGGPHVGQLAERLAAIAGPPHKGGGHAGAAGFTEWASTAELWS